jgi:hypothetical protein
MKKFFPLLTLAAIFAFSACKEAPIEIPDLKGGKRRVLVEEVTGVGCPNCPDGTRTLTNLQGTFKAEGRELIVVSIHAAGNFSVPYPSSKVDFRNAEAQALVGSIGVLEGFPCAAVDRRLLPDETTTFVTPHTRWEGIIRADFAQDFGLDMFIENNFNPSTRMLDIKVDLLPDQILSGDLRLTVLITEDSIIDAQLDKGVFNPNYVHRHALRDVVTNVDGNPIGETLNQGSFVRRSFSVPLKPEWSAKHCSVVAFVHRNGSPNKEVLQAAERHVEY